MSSSCRNQESNQRIERQSPSTSVMENHYVMPNLQDLLGDYDMFGLEEFAESLLADVTENLAESFTKGSGGDAKVEGTAERQSERLVVGTTTEDMESSKNTNRNLELTQIKCIHDDLVNSSSIFERSKNIAIAPTTTPSPNSNTNSNSVYGTYDEKTNSITILVSADDIPMDDGGDVEEEVICIEETTSENGGGESKSTSTSSTEDEEMLLNHGAESIVEILSPISNTMYHDDDRGGVDHKKSTIESSPRISDHGYESIGSPSSEVHSFDELWNDSLSQLFPSLV